MVTMSTRFMAAVETLELTKVLKLQAGRPASSRMRAIGWGCS